MKSIKPTIQIMLKARPGKDGKQDVRIRVRYPDGKDVSYATGVRLSKDKYVSIFRKKHNIRSVDDRAAYVKVMEHYTRAEKLSNDGPGGAEMFEVLYTGAARDMSSLQDCLLVIIDERQAKTERERKRYGCDSHIAVLNFLNTQFGRGIHFSEVNEAFLTDLNARWELAGASINTIARYHNVIRALFNLAIHTWKTVSPSLYPYGRGGFVCQTLEKDNGNLLRDDEWELWNNYKPTDEKEKEARDFWFLSYYLGGVNFKDIFTYRKSYISKDLSTIRYIRSKSSRSKKVVKEVSKHVDTRARQIIRRRMAKTLDPNAYLFPLVNDGMSYKSLLRKIQNFTFNCNAITKGISDKLGISVPVKTYTARHTASDTLTSKGVSDAVLQEILDHNDPRTTQKYKHRMRLRTQEKIFAHL